jgi:NAD(P) transhydrogenase subunit alpha
MVESMKPGSVIVDLASEQGGNCTLTEPGKVVQHKGVTIVGYTDLPSRMSSMSSQLYGATVTALLSDMTKDGEIAVNLEDEVVRGAIVLHNGKMMWPPPAPPTPPAPPEPGVPTKSSASVAAAKAKSASSGHGHGEGVGLSPTALVIIGIVLLLVGYAAPDAGAPASTLSHFTVFVLACFVGWQVIWNVKPALHTPLMSVTNAISGIILVGGMLQLSGLIKDPVTIILGVIAVAIAAINIAGGFLVTNRMLGMFRK